MRGRAHRQSRRPIGPPSCSKWSIWSRRFCPGSSSKTSHESEPVPWLTELCQTASTCKGRCSVRQAFDAGRTNGRERTVSLGRTTPCKSATPPFRTAAITTLPVLRVVSHLQGIARQTSRRTSKDMPFARRTHSNRIPRGPPSDAVSTTSSRKNTSRMCEFSATAPSSTGLYLLMSSCAASLR